MKKSSLKWSRKGMNNIDISDILQTFNLVRDDECDEGIILDANPDN